MIQQLTSITAPRKPTRNHDVLTWASDVSKCLRQLIDRGLSGGTGYKLPRAYDQFIPPFYLEPISEFVLRVHPGKLILTIHNWIISDTSTPDVDVERLSGNDGKPLQVIPTVFVDPDDLSLTQYRDLVIPSSSPGHPCLVWKTLVSYGDASLTYVADSAEVKFLSTTTWADPPDYPGTDTETTHIFQLGTYTASSGETGAITNQLRGNVFYTHEKLWAD